MGNHKVYILTFHGSVNYGALMQAYALSTAVRRLGYPCELIDYNRHTHHRNFLRLQWNGSIKNKFYQLYRWIPNFLLHRKFNRFLLKNCILTPKSYDGFHVLDQKEFDQNALYIVGSDQIWNCELTCNNTHYFLDFVNSPNKYSYAASFGVSELREKDEPICREYLSQFKRITVREEQGCKIVFDLLGVSPEVVCDPTFLLEPADWKSVSRTVFNKPYILLFLLENDPRLVELARKLSQEHHLPIYNIAYSVRKIPGVRDVSCVSPEQWIGLIKNAEFVLTNSFHGTAVSLNLERQLFIGLLNTQINSRNSRLLNIVHRYGIEEIIVSEGTHADQRVNYNTVRQKMNEDRVRSLKILEELCNGAGE